MNIKVVIKRLNLYGMNFTAESGLDRNKNYKLKLTTALPQGEVELCFKISIIKITELKADKCEYRSLYRHLNGEQLLKINEIIDYYATDTKLKLSDIVAVVTRREE